MTSISQERSKLAAVGQSLRRRDAWGARRSYTDANAVTEPASRVFVHISVTNPSSYNSDDAHARSIEAIGISRFPNTGISYNRLLMRSGKAYEGQPIGRRGAHTVNDFRRSTCSTSGCPGRGGSLSAPDWNLNYNARAYVICQNTSDSVTDAQLDALARAIAADKLAGFVTRGAQLHGHRCVSSKSCPGDKMWSRMGELEKKVNNYLANGLDEAKEWWEMAIPNSELDKIAERVWDRLNVDGHTMGTLLKWAEGNARTAKAAVSEVVEDPVTGEEETPRTMWRWARLRSYNANEAAKDVRSTQAAQLAKLDAILSATGAQVDESAIAQEVAALLVPAVVAALAGVVSITEQQVEDAAERAIREVLGSVDE